MRNKHKAWWFYLNRHSQCCTRDTHQRADPKSGSNGIGKTGYHRPHTSVENTKSKKFATVSIRSYASGVNRQCTHYIFRLMGNITSGVQHAGEHGGQHPQRALKNLEIFTAVIVKPTLCLLQLTCGVEPRSHQHARISPQQRGSKRLPLCVHTRVRGGVDIQRTRHVSPHGPYHHHPGGSTPSGASDKQTHEHNLPRVSTQRGASATKAHHHPRAQHRGNPSPPKNAIEQSPRVSIHR